MHANTNTHSCIHTYYVSRKSREITEDFPFNDSRVSGTNLQMNGE